MDLLVDTLGFAAKGFIVFLTIAASAVVVSALARRRRGGRPHLEVKHLNDRFLALGDALRRAVLGKKELKALHRERKQQKADHTRPRVYVLDFDGDLLATGVTSLREEVTAVAALAGEGDEVVVRLESPGGAVSHYGLAASQLARLKERKLKVTVCVDRVAASGGYLMACVADRIVAAPFSVIGSIGVVAQVPNVHRLLKRHDVDFEELTAGEFKRTVSVFGEITAKGRQKFVDQLDETHALFKAFVRAQRPSLDVDRVATGEYWLGSRGLELGLVDQLGTSDEYLLGLAKDANLYQVRYRPEPSWRTRLGAASAEVVERVVLRLLGRLQAVALR
jgi:serine protease SohB